MSIIMNIRKMLGIAQTEGAINTIVLSECIPVTAETPAQTTEVTTEATAVETDDAQTTTVQTAVESTNEAVAETTDNTAQEAAESAAPEVTTEAVQPAVTTEKVAQVAADTSANTVSNDAQALVAAHAKIASLENELAAEKGKVTLLQADATAYQGIKTEYENLKSWKANSEKGTPLAGANDTADTAVSEPRKMSEATRNAKVLYDKKMRKSGEG